MCYLPTSLNGNNSQLNLALPFWLPEFTFILLMLAIISSSKKTGKHRHVCPICSIKVVSDMLSHITLQHGHLFKISFEMFYCNRVRYQLRFSLTEYYIQRRRRLRRVAIPNSQALSLSGRDLREAHLQVLLGGSGYRSSNANSSNAVIDPFLSSLILNFPSSES
ncbi:hypothetical protein HYC85_002782 [Camellia sinensis]|uniref:Drought induced 19 protein type zinc-binding domain-containing protein n=1 Tax=Camellia sinensis TaxID=4442 RepID=A0A7J7I993_CAMSI|nr:hypothetical protein HYC85_002782 [Camellia sinensis]